MHKKITDYKPISLLAALFVIIVLACCPVAVAQEAGGGLDQGSSTGSSANSTTGQQASTTTQSTAGGPVNSAAGGAAPTMSTTGDVNDMNQGTDANLMQQYYWRNLNAQHFAATQYGGSDVIQNGQSLGPGLVNQAASGPIQMWPVIIPAAASAVPTFRDQAISQNLFQTFGYPVSDTQFQIIQRYNDNIFLEQLFNPERVMWMTNAMGQLQATKTANNTANIAQNQATSAIEHVEVFMTNFANEAADPGNMWHQLLNNLFIPMAILLLFVGAVLAQVVAIAAQGTSILGNVNPLDGLLRSVIAVFLIPFTQVAMSWCIDVGNSISQSIPTAYYTQFGRDMYQDAICAEKKAFPINPPNNNYNAIIPSNNSVNTSTGTIEGMDFNILGGWDPCSSIMPANSNTTVPDESEQFVMSASRFMCNMGNSTLTMTWNVLCAFQTAYLYYLWCMGPIVAALWVWPMQQLRNALPQWFEGLITLCFWSLFWNTSVLLLACFYGVNTNGDTGTMYISALNLLALLSVKFAFNFSSLTTSLGFMAEGMAMSKIGGAQHGGQQHGGGAPGAAMHGGFAHGGAPGYGGGLAPGSFVPGQHGAQQMPGVPGTGVAANTGLAAATGVAVGGGMATGTIPGTGINIGAASTPGGLTMDPGLTGGGIPGTGYGIGLNPSSYGANLPGFMPAGSGGYAAGDMLAPTSSGVGAPGALNTSGIYAGGTPPIPVGASNSDLAVTGSSNVPYVPGVTVGSMLPPGTSNPNLSVTPGTSYDTSTFGVAGGAAPPDTSIPGTGGNMTPGGDPSVGAAPNLVPDNGPTNWSLAQLAGLSPPPSSYNPDLTLTPGNFYDPSIPGASSNVTPAGDPNIGTTANLVPDTNSATSINPYSTSGDAQYVSYNPAQDSANSTSYPAGNTPPIVVFPASYPASAPEPTYTYAPAPTPEPVVYTVAQQTVEPPQEQAAAPPATPNLQYTPVTVGLNSPSMAPYPSSAPPPPPSAAPSVPLVADAPPSGEHSGPGQQQGSLQKLMAQTQQYRRKRKPSDPDFPDGPPSST